MTVGDPYQGYIEEWTSANGSEADASGSQTAPTTPARRILGFQVRGVEPKPRFKTTAGNQHAKARTIPLVRLGGKTTPLVMNFRKNTRASPVLEAANRTILEAKESLPFKSVAMRRCASTAS